MNNTITAYDEATVKHALGLLDQAITILDGEELLVAAAKVEDAREALRHTAGRSGHEPG